MSREALRTYFLSVTGDLIQRGVIRRRQGQPLADIMKIEMRAVLAQVEKDFIVVGTELGIGFLSTAGVALGGALQHGIERTIERTARAVGNWLNGKR